MLRYARPLHLKLEGTTGSMLGNPDRGVISMLREGCGANLRGTLVLALACLPLKSLKMRFETHGLDPTPRMAASTRPARTASRAPLTPAEVSLNALDMDALVARLDSIPSREAALGVIPNSRDSEVYERTITKATSRLAGHEQ
ncbi:hypothetical protein LXA43DRAFT_1104016 [Ganoderma leucocontextum]|nr:hypothetical protein LXA43DRAFT_1104016 [Ganoderma leucocontextum]